MNVCFFIRKSWLFFSFIFLQLPAAGAGLKASARTNEGLPQLNGNSSRGGPGICPGPTSTSYARPGQEKKNSGPTSYVCTWQKRQMWPLRLEGQQERHQYLCQVQKFPVQAACCRFLSELCTGLVFFSLEMTLLLSGFAAVLESGKSP